MTHVDRLNEKGKPAANVQTIPSKKTDAKEKKEMAPFLPFWAREILLIYEKVQKMNRSGQSSSQ